MPSQNAQVLFWAICDVLYRAGPSLLIRTSFQQSQVRRVTVLAEERLLPPIAPLRHGVRDTGNHNARQPCHITSLPIAPDTVNNIRRNEYGETMKQASFRIVDH